MWIFYFLYRPLMNYCILFRFFDKLKLLLIRYINYNTLHEKKKFEINYPKLQLLIHANKIITLMKLVYHYISTEFYVKNKYIHERMTISIY